MERRSVSRMIDRHAKIEQLNEDIFITDKLLFRHRQLIRTNTMILSSLNKDKHEKWLYVLNGNMFIKRDKDQTISIIEENQKAMLSEVSELEEKLKENVRELETIEKGNVDQLK